MSLEKEPAKNRKPVQNNRKPKKPVAIKNIADDISDLEVARKMIKIYQSAQDRKLEFNLSFESVKKLLSYHTCYYTNRVFDEDGPFSRSFDRIDSAKGYIENNVVACTVDINGKKSNLSMEEIECLYTKLIKYHTKKSDQAIKSEISNLVTSIVSEIVISNEEPEEIRDSETSEGTAKVEDI
jgi:hypothetical protein